MEKTEVELQKKLQNLLDHKVTLLVKRSKTKNIVEELLVESEINDINLLIAFTKNLIKFKRGELDDFSIL